MTLINDPVLKRIWLLLGLLIVAWLFYSLLPVIVPFALAWILAYLLNPLILALKKRGFSRIQAILSVLLLLALGMALLLSWLIPVVFEQIKYAQQSWPEFLNWVNQTMLPWLNNGLGLDIPIVDLNSLGDSLITYLQSNYSSDGTSNLIAWLTQSGLSVANIAGIMVLIPIVSFYMLIDWESMLSRLSLLIPRRHEAAFSLLIKDCHNVLGAFVRGQLTVMLCLGLIYAVGLELVGLDLGLIIGMVAGLSSIIPYAGFIVGLAIALIAGLFQMGFDPLTLALILAVFLFGQAMEGYVLQPKLLGNRIGLNPVVVIFSVLAGAKLMGLGGMLIALPVAAVIKVLLGRLYARYLNSSWYREIPSQVLSIETQDCAPANKADTASDEPPWLEQIQSQSSEKV